MCINILDRSQSKGHSELLSKDLEIEFQRIFSILFLFLLGLV